MSVRTYNKRKAKTSGHNYNTRGRNLELEMAMGTANIGTNDVEDVAGGGESLASPMSTIPTITTSSISRTSDTAFLGFEQESMMLTSTDVIGRRPGTSRVVHSPIATTTYNHVMSTEPMQHLSLPLNSSSSGAVPKQNQHVHSRRQVDFDPASIQQHIEQDSGVFSDMPTTDSWSLMTSLPARQVSISSNRNYGNVNVISCSTQRSPHPPLSLSSGAAHRRSQHNPNTHVTFSNPHPVQSIGTPTRHYEEEEHPNYSQRPIYDQRRQNIQQFSIPSQSQRSQEMYSYSPSSQISHPPNVNYTNRLQQRPHVSQGPNVNHKSVMNSWTISYSSFADPLPCEEFLFRVETLARRYAIADRELGTNIHVLLKDKASDWYWTQFCRDAIEFTWDEFKRSFINYYQRLTSDFEIVGAMMNARQGNTSFDDFVQKLIVYRNQMRNPMPEVDLINIIRDNMDTRLAQMTFTASVLTLQQLREVCRRAERYLATQTNRIRQTYRPRVNEINTWNPQDAYYNFETDVVMMNTDSTVRTDAEILPNAICNYEVENAEVDEVANGRSRATCWNCRRMGHYFQDCPENYRRLFCFKCGCPGTTSPRCPKCSGNRVPSGQRNGTSHSTMNPVSQADRPLNQPPRLQLTPK